MDTSVHLLEHAIKTTRVRVANLCCAGEERIIRTALDKMKGIEKVSVNIIGRYAIIQHCNVECCSPSSLIAEVLNKQHLGVSIQEMSSVEEEKEESVDTLHLLYILAVWVMLLVGLCLFFVSDASEDMLLASDLLFILSVVIGSIPILKGAYVSVIRKSIDIHILILLAIIGAIVAQEFFDASLVVALFITAELVEVSKK